MLASARCFRAISLRAVTIPAWSCASCMVRAVPVNTPAGPA
jgi:hypothetical protein